MNNVVDEVYVPIGPFRTWLRGLLAEQLGLGNETPMESVAERLKVSRRVLQRYLNDPRVEVIGFSLVDRAVSGHGGFSFIDVYGAQEYEAVRFPSPRRAGQRVYRCHECHTELLKRAYRCEFCAQERGEWSQSQEDLIAC